MYEICSFLATKLPERQQMMCIFTVNFEQILHIVLGFPLNWG